MENSIYSRKGLIKLWQKFYKTTILTTENFLYKVLRIRQEIAE
jgi:hypothetical protein